MTANQIRYAELQERQRNNLVTEKETGRHNVADEAIRMRQVGASYASVAEARRHNMEQEAINWQDLEDQRPVRNSQALRNTLDPWINLGGNLLKAAAPLVLA